MSSVGSNISSRETAVPHPAPLLFLLASAVLWIFLSDTIGPLQLVILGLLGGILGIAAIRAFSRRIQTGIWVLCAAVVMSRFYVQIGGLKARPEHVVTGLLFIAAALVWKKRSVPVRWIVADYLVVAYIALNILSSLVMSVAPAQTLKWALQQTLVITPYFLLRVLIVDRDSFRRAVRILIVVGAAEAAYAICCFLSNVVFGTSFGVEIDQYGSFPGTYGTLYEANILGSFCGASSVMALILYFQERRKLFLWAAVLSLGGMIVALSRAAILGTIITLVFALAIAFKKGLVDWKATRNVRVSIVALLLLLGPLIVPLYLDRFSTVGPDVTADDDTAIRIASTLLAADDIVQHPVLGNGTASFQLLVNASELGFGANDDMRTWIGNTEIRVLHDMGIVGLCVFLWFLLSLFLGVRRVLKREPQPELLALLLPAILYSITFQATEGTFLAFTWVHLGLIGCAISLFDKPAHEVTEFPQVSLG